MATYDAFRDGPIYRTNPGFARTFLSDWLRSVRDVISGWRDRFLGHAPSHRSRSSQYVGARRAERRRTDPGRDHGRVHTGPPPARTPGTRAAGAGQATGTGIGTSTGTNGPATGSQVYAGTPSPAGKPPGWFRRQWDRTKAKPAWVATAVLAAGTAIVVAILGANSEDGVNRSASSPGSDASNSEGRMGRGDHTGPATGGPTPGGSTPVPPAPSAPVAPVYTPVVHAVAMENKLDLEEAQELVELRRTNPYQFIVLVQSKEVPPSGGMEIQSGDTTTDVTEGLIMSAAADCIRLGVELTDDQKRFCATTGQWASVVNGNRDAVQSFVAAERERSQLSDETLASLAGIALR